MAFRDRGLRERPIREVYEERVLDRPVPYQRGVGGMERRSAFGRAEDDYGRGFDYDNPRFYPNDGPRSYHGEDQRGYHGDGLHFPNERRSGPPRREDPYVYREEAHAGRHMEFRSSSRAGPPPNVRVQGLNPPPRSLSAVAPEGADDTLIAAILNLDRGEERESYRRKGHQPPFPPPRDRSPLRRDVPLSPHSRSGSSLSSRSYSPERSKSHPYQSQQSKNKDKPPGPSVNISRDGSPQSTVSTSKEEVHVSEAERDEASAEETQKVLKDFQERRAQAIAAKAQEIEKVYRKDCETFGMVVKMLVAKEPNLEKQLQTPLKENLSEIRERCLDDLRHFISELDEVVRQPEPSA